MRGVARLPARLGGKARLDRRKPGFHLFEYEALLRGLVGAELFRTLAEASATKRLQHRRQSSDLGVGRGIGLGKIADFSFQPKRLGAESFGLSLVGLRFHLETISASCRGERQRFELVNVVRKLARALYHASDNSTLVDESPAFPAFINRFAASSGALRRPNVYRANPFPIQPFNQRHKLRMTEPHLATCRRRPAEMRTLQALRKQA